MNWYTHLMEKSSMANDISQHNHDTVYAIVRDVKDGNLTVNDAVARLKGLQDGTELTVDSYETADNVKDNKEEEVEFTPVVDTVDPGVGADADINDIVGVDETDDTTTMGVVPDDQLVSEKTKMEGDVLVSTEEAKTPEASDVKPAGGSEPAPSPKDEVAEEAPKKKRTSKKDTTKDDAEDNSR